MKCPVDVDVELVMSERQGVEIDYCPRCRGVWLDRGELDKILDRALPAGASADSRREPHQGDFHGDSHAGEHDGRDERGKKRKGSWLGDLLDFG